MDTAEVLKRPYTRMVLPHPDGTYTAEIAEFPGCVAVGSDANEAIANVEEVAIDWINVALKQGQDIPEPMESIDYSGKLVLRMPKSLHKRSAFFADREGVSLNQFILTCLAEAVGERARSSMSPRYSIEATAQLIVTLPKRLHLLPGTPNPMESSTDDILELPAPYMVSEGSRA